MKKVISLLLAVLMIAGVLGISFSASAEQADLPIDGTEISGNTTKEAHYNTYTFTLEKRGTVEFTVVADAKLRLITLQNEKTGDVRSVVNYSADDFKTDTFVQKSGLFYLEAGDYSVELYGVETSYMLSAKYTEYTAADGSKTLSVSKPSTLFFSQWSKPHSLKVIVKKAYRVSFEIEHGMPIACNVKKADGTVVYSTKNFNSGTTTSPAKQEISFNLAKGTYYLNLRALPGKKNANETGGIYTVTTKVGVYVKPPVSFGTITRKTNALTISYNKVKGVAGYEVQRSSGTKWVDTKRGNSVTCAFKKLTAGTVYKFRVRSYVVENGKKYYSDWSKTYKSATKPEQVKIKSVSSDKAGKVTTQWYKSTGNCTGYEIAFSYDRFNTIGWKTTVSAGKKDIQSLAVLKLKSGRLCYVKVRAYTVCGSQKVYAPWSLYSSVYVK
ncbi:MAG: hypothetical protein IKE65_05265 [Clostridia bacterium]|nr:hypothetical protein [Clostridia bacterium]